MGNLKKLEKLRVSIKALYFKNKKKLLFHGWHHLVFVGKKARELAASIKADVFLVESASLVHDLNYLVHINSRAGVGGRLREIYLTKAGYLPAEIARIEKIVLETETATRTKKMSKEGMALSDGDTLMKALPITPILFASKYIAENNVDIEKLAAKIISEQNKLMRSGIYFYTPLAKKKYLAWARINLALWNNVSEALADKDVAEMLATAKALKVL